MTGNGKDIPLIYMSNITRRFGLIAAVRNVNFSVSRGEVVGLLGDNGAGKSTLIKVLTGVHPATEGQIYFEGRPVRISSPKIARTLGIETVYQDLALVNLMSISRNFFLGREITHRMGPIRMLDKEAMNERTVEALADIGIHIRRPEEEVLRMSGGERQSIAIGRAAHFGLSLLILDEPTSALSVGESQKVLSYTLEAKKAGLGVIFITHNVGHVYQVADRFTIISRGHKIGDFLRDEVSEKEISDMIMGGPVPEHLQPVIAEREQELEQLRDQIDIAAEPITIAERAKTRRRNQLVIAGLLLAVVVIIGLLVGSGAFSAIDPTATPTIVPTVDMAEVPQEILDLHDQLLNDPDSGQRAIAASKLGASRYQHPSSVEPLIQALQDEAFEVRASAAKALGRLGDRRAIDPLQELLRDNQSSVRDEAAAALQNTFGLTCSAAEGCKE